MNKKGFNLGLKQHRLVVAGEGKTPFSIDPLNLFRFLGAIVPWGHCSLDPLPDTITFTPLTVGRADKRKKWRALLRCVRFRVTGAFVSVQ